MGCEYYCITKFLHELVIMDNRFRWVECQLNILKRCVTAVRIREALNDLPTDLNATYERILLDINKDEHEGKVVRRALDWLIAALEPLQLPQIMEGLSIDPKQRILDRDSGPVHGLALLDALGSLVTYDEVTDVVILSHFSVKVCFASFYSFIIYAVILVGIPDWRAHSHQTVKISYRPTECS